MTGPLAAYVLAADPWWLEASLRSYYDLVDRIVVSYDQDGLSWTGTPLPVDDCLEIVRRVDVAGKCDYRPGHYARLDQDPMDNETFQRQAALDVAGEEAEWVLQLDTDEILQRPDVFVDCLQQADTRSTIAGMEFPARWLYTTVASSRFTRMTARPGHDWYLERCRRFWGVSATYPGPVAVRAGVRLTVARQGPSELFRVDYRAQNTDTHHASDVPVHRVIGAAEGILHFSWVRDLEYMARKAGWSGHTVEYVEPSRIRNWRRASRSPFATVASVPMASVDARFRLVRLPTATWSGPRERALLGLDGGDQTDSA